jgi:hypothetical protein
MAAPLPPCTKEEQGSVIRFLISEGVKSIEVQISSRIIFDLESDQSDVDF